MKRFNRELNITIKEYINIKKILNSLEHYNYNNKILNIAFKSGYNSLEYYSEIFTTLVGVSPRIYKKYILQVNNLTDDEINIIRINLTNLITIDIKIKNIVGTINNDKKIFFLSFLNMFISFDKQIISKCFNKLNNLLN